MTTAELFTQHKFAVARGVVPVEVCEKLDEYVKSIEQYGVYDHQVPNSPAFYNDQIMAALHHELLPTVEELTGLKLFPSYVYFRSYRQGAVLAPHTDRPACEISTSLTIADDGSGWPLFAKNPDGNLMQADLAPGDMLLYRGCECEHWRDEYQGSRQVQVFFHYVDQNNPRAEELRNDRVKLQ